MAGWTGLDRTGFYLVFPCCHLNATPKAFNLNHNSFINWVRLRKIGWPGFTQSALYLSRDLKVDLPGPSPTSTLGNLQSTTFLVQSPYWFCFCFANADEDYGSFGYHTEVKSLRSFCLFQLSFSAHLAIFMISEVTDYGRYKSETPVGQNVPSANLWL